MEGLGFKTKSISIQSAEIHPENLFYILPRRAMKAMHMLPRVFHTDHRLRTSVI